jgi:hypothetical protein
MQEARQRGTARVTHSVLAILGTSNGLGEVTVAHGQKDVTSLLLQCPQIIYLGTLLGRSPAS